MSIRLGLACLLVLLAASSAEARREQIYRYPYTRVWSAVLRMLRVDYESPITEKDAESGYFLFEFPLDGKQNPGSAELVRTLEGGVETVRVVLQVPALPTYVEQMLLDKLKRKLSEEFGDPTMPNKKEKPGSGGENAPDQPAPPAAPKEPAPKAGAPAPAK